MPPFPIHVPAPTTPFPTYLLPSLPFRRRQSSTSSAASTTRSDSISSASPSETETSFLTGANSHLRCGRCLADLALSSQIISKGFVSKAPHHFANHNPLTTPDRPPRPRLPRRALQQFDQPQSTNPPHGSAEERGPAQPPQHLHSQARAPPTRHRRAHGQRHQLRAVRQRARVEVRGG